jgi:hypothetical protein
MRVEPETELARRLAVVQDIRHRLPASSAQDVVVDDPVRAG